MNPAKKEVAEKLRHYRESCALSQQQVADALNIERSTYTKYETGKCDPGVKTLVKLARIFNIDPVDLLPIESAEDERVKRLRDATRADSPIFQLSKDERGLIARYRALDKAQKKQVMELMGNLSKNDS